MSQIALITGASSGIGKELAIIHAERGGDLVIVARRVKKLEALKRELIDKYGIKVAVIVADLTKPQAPQQIYQKVKKAGVTVDYLMNNAGFGLRGKFFELPWERQLEMMNLNMVALTELTYLFLPDFIKRKSGKVLNTSSTASLMPGPLQAVYFASKAYVTSFGNALSEELRGTNVTVTTLMPGATDTEFGATSGMDNTKMFDKPFPARSVAEDGYQGMLKGKLDVISGLTFSQRVMMSMLPVTPKKMLIRQVREMQEPK